MASRIVFTDVPGDPREALLGLGPRLDVGGRSFLVMTMANRCGGNRLWEQVAAVREGRGIATAGREVAECSVSGEMVDVDPLAFSVLRRAVAVADGNSFYGEGLDSRECDDLSIQYGREANHALMALEGLNVVPEDLAVAALIGRTAHDVIRPGASPLGDPVDALARVLARMVADGAGDVDAARTRLDDVVARAHALLGGCDVAGVSHPGAGPGEEA